MPVVFNPSLVSHCCLLGRIGFSLSQSPSSQSPLFPIYLCTSVICSNLNDDRALRITAFWPETRLRNSWTSCLFSKESLMTTFSWNEGLSFFFFLQQMTVYRVDASAKKEDTLKFQPCFSPWWIFAILK